MGVLGVVFIGMELYEFVELIYEGVILDVSVYLLVYFILVVMYGLYVMFGLLWLVIMIY